MLIAGEAPAQEIVYYHTDALGSPVAVTDASGVVLERSEYEPFGALLNRAPVDGLGYTGHAFDAETGLNYMQQRYQDPILGQFLSADPVAAHENVAGNFNRYWYGNNNPYKFTDPDGRLSFASGATATGSAIAGGSVSTQWVYSFPSLDPKTWSVGVLTQGGLVAGTGIGGGLSGTFTWNLSANSAEEMAGSGPSASAGGSVNILALSGGYDHDLGGDNQSISIGLKADVPAEIHTSVSVARGRTILTGRDFINAAKSLIPQVPAVQVGPPVTVPSPAVPPFEPQLKETK